MKVLLVLTSSSELGNTAEKSGLWIEEFAAPYYALAAAGAELTIASPKGGQLPVGPKIESTDAQNPATKRFYEDDVLIDKITHTLKLSEVNQADYDAIFYPGGNRSSWDLATNTIADSLMKIFKRTMNRWLSYVMPQPLYVRLKRPMANL